MKSPTNFLKGSGMGVFIFLSGLMVFHGMFLGFSSVFSLHVETLEFNRSLIGLFVSSSFISFDRSWFVSLSPAEFAIL